MGGGGVGAAGRWPRRHAAKHCSSHVTAPFRACMPMERNPRPPDVRDRAVQTWRHTHAGATTVQTPNSPSTSCDWQEPPPDVLDQAVHQHALHLLHSLAPEGLYTRGHAGTQAQGRGGVTGLFCMPSLPHRLLPLRLALPCPCGRCARPATSAPAAPGVYLSHRAEALGGSRRQAVGVAGRHASRLPLCHQGCCWRCCRRLWLRRRRRCQHGSRRLDAKRGHHGGRRRRWAASHVRHALAFAELRPMPCRLPGRLDFRLQSRLLHRLLRPLRLLLLRRRRGLALLAGRHPLGACPLCLLHLLILLRLRCWRRRAPGRCGSRDRR